MILKLVNAVEKVKTRSQISFFQGGTVSQFMYNTYPTLPLLFSL